MVLPELHGDRPHDRKARRPDVVESEVRQPADPVGEKTAGKERDDADPDALVPEARQRVERERLQGDAAEDGRPGLERKGQNCHATTPFLSFGECLWTGRHCSICMEGCVCPFSDEGRRLKEKDEG